MRAKAAVPLFFILIFCFTPLTLSQQTTTPSQLPATTPKPAAVKKAAPAARPAQKPKPAAAPARAAGSAAEALPQKPAVPVPPPLSPEAQQAFDKGVMAAQQQDFPLAIRYFEQASKIAPYNPDLLFNLALAESKVPGREARSIARFNAYLAADPNSAKSAQIGEQLKILEVKIESSVLKLIGSGKDLANQYSGYQRDSALAEVAKAQAETGDVPGAKETLTSTNGSKDLALSDVAYIQAKAGDIAGAKDTIRSIAESTWQDLASSRVATLQANNGDIPGAESTLSNIRQPYSQQLALVPLGEAYMKKGDTQAAYTIFSRARDRINECRQPNDIVGYHDNSYYTLATAQARAGDIPGALQTIDLLSRQDNGVFDYRANSYQAVDAYYEDAGSKLVKAGDIRGALAMLSKMTGSGGHKENLQRAIGTKLLESGDIQGATAVAASMAAGNPKDNLLGAIGNKIYEQFKEKFTAHDVAGAQQIAASIPDPGRKCDAYRDLALQAIPLNDNATLNSLMAQISCPLSKAEVYLAIGAAQKKAGNVRQALDLYSTACRATAQQPIDKNWSWNNQPIYQMYSKIGVAQAQAGDISAALQTASYIPADTFGKGTAYSAVADVQLEKNDYEAAKRTADMLPSGSSDRAAIYHNIAVKQAQAGNFPAAGLTASFIPADSYYGSSTYQDISDEQAKTGDFAAARQLAALVREPSYRSTAYKNIAEKQAAKGDIDGALESAALIPDANVKDSAYQSVGWAQIFRADFAGAQKTFGMITSLEKKAEAYRNSTYYYSSPVENLEAVKQRLEQARQITGQIVDPEAQAHAWLELAGKWLGLDETARAREALALAHKSALQIKDPDRRALTFDYWNGSLFSGYSDLGQWSSAEESIWLALDSAMGMKPDSAQSRFSYFSDALTKHFDYAGAKELIYQIKDEGQRESALVSMAGIEVDQHNFRLARRDLAEIKDKDRRDAILTAILNRQIADKDLSAAAQTFAELTTSSARKSDAYSLAYFYIRAKDLASGRAWVKRTEMTDYQASSLCSDFADAGDIAWGRIVVNGIVDVDYRDWCLRDIGIAQVKAGNVEDAKRTVLMIREKNRGSVIAQIAATDLDWSKARFADTASAKLSILQAIAGAGDVAWAQQNVGAIGESERDSAFSSIAAAQGKKGDFAGAKTTASSIASIRDRASALAAIAAQQAQAADLAGAMETLKLARETYGGLGADFDSWAGYWIALAQKSDPIKHDAAAAAITAAAIKDKYWRSQAYLALASGNDTTGPELLAAVPDPLMRSRGYLAAVRSRVAQGDLANAIKLAGKASDAEYKSEMYGAIVTAALAAPDLSTVMPVLASLPDGAGKAYMYLHLAKLKASDGDANSAATLLATAKKAIVAMPNSFAKARAYAEISKSAAEAEAAQLSEESSRLAATTGRVLMGDEKQQWASYLNPGVPAPGAGSPASPSPANATAEDLSKKKIEPWAALINDDLSKPLFTDFQAYIQSLSGRSSSGEILNGVLQAVRDLTAALEKVKKLEAEQQNAKITVPQAKSNGS
jgi:hypothetical protein